MSAYDFDPDAHVSPYERIKLNRAYSQRGFISPGMTILEQHDRGCVPVGIMSPIQVRNASTRKRLRMDRTDQARVTAALRAMG